MENSQVKNSVNVSKESQKDNLDLDLIPPMNNITLNESKKKNIVKKEKSEFPNLKFTKDSSKLLDYIEKLNSRTVLKTLIHPLKSCNQDKILTKNYFDTIDKLIKTYKNNSSFLMSFNEENNPSFKADVTVLFEPICKLYSRNTNILNKANIVISKLIVGISSSTEIDNILLPDFNDPDLKYLQTIFNQNYEKKIFYTLFSIALLLLNHIEIIDSIDLSNEPDQAAFLTKLLADHKIDLIKSKEKIINLNGDKTVSEKEFNFIIKKKKETNNKSKHVQYSETIGNNPSLVLNDNTSNIMFNQEDSD